MKINSKDFRVREGDEVNLKKWPTKVDPVYKSKEHCKEPLEEHVAQLSSQQQLLYASNRHAILLIFQAMDAAGKDGSIRHVMSGVNPQGCQVFSFKHPTAGELEHNFLWRTTRDLPERGKIGIFNRSYYEEVLILRVHPEILRSEAIPDTPHHDKKVWHDRYRSIVDLEKHLHGNGTGIIKFLLHLSKEEQRKRFLARIDEPEKNWKFSTTDIAERKLWKDYMKAYEGCFTATSTGRAPWYVVPADDKENARLIVSQLMSSTHSKDSKWPFQKRAQSAVANCCQSASNSRSAISSKAVIKERAMYTNILFFVTTYLGQRTQEPLADRLQLRPRPRPGERRRPDRRSVHGGADARNRRKARVVASGPDSSRHRTWQKKTLRRAASGHIDRNPRL